MSTTLAPMRRATAVHHPTGWEVWRRWTLFTAAGELVGFAVPALAMAVGPEVGLSDTAQVGAAIVVGAVEGAVLGFAQWLALRRYLPTLSRRQWVLSTALGAMVAYLLAMTAMALVDAVYLPAWLRVALAVVLGIGFLVSIGLPQWFVLRGHLRHAGWWVPANALAWPLGVAVPFTVLFLVPDASPAWVFAVAGIASGVAMGLVVGAVTGIALVWLLHSRVALRQ